MGTERVWHAWQVLDSMLTSVGVPYSYGFAIILLTILVKIVTYPLTKKQVPAAFACTSARAAPPSCVGLPLRGVGRPSCAHTPCARRLGPALGRLCPQSVHISACVSVHTCCVLAALGMACDGRLSTCFWGRGFAGTWFLVRGLVSVGTVCLV